MNIHTFSILMLLDVDLYVRIAIKVLSNLNIIIRLSTFIQYW